MKGDMHLAWSKGQAPENSIGGGVVSALLRFALESGRVDGVLTTRRRNGNRYDGVPVVVTDPQELADTGGNLHCVTPNIARCLKEYLGGAFDRRLAVVCKPCDARAIIELVKRNQINRDNVLLIGLNCTGTLSPGTAKRMYLEEFGLDPSAVKDERVFPPGNKFFAVLQDGTEITKPLDELEAKGFGRRENCRRCTVNIPRMADLACGKWGTHGRPVSFVEVCSETGAAFFDAALAGGAIEVEPPTPEIIAEREKYDQASIKLAQEWSARLHESRRGMELDERREFWFGLFDQCIKCYGCRDACPICYCRECILEARRGVVPAGEVPPQAVFGLVRAIHVADSCVNCGQCEDACPVGIPLTSLISLLQEDIQSVFKYEPGMDVQERPPLTTLTQGESGIQDVGLQF